MIVIKMILFILCMLFIWYRIGVLVNVYFKKSRIFEILIYGFITYLAINQIFMVPCIVLNVNFKLVYIVSNIINVILVVLSYIFRNISNSKYKFTKELIIFKNLIKNNIIISIISIILIVISIFLSSYLFNENADDAFYVSLINMNIDNEKIYNDIEPSLGIENGIFLRKYEISSYELLISVLCKTYKISATVMCHTVLPVLFILIAYSVYYYFSKFIIKKKHLTYFFLLIVMFLFSGISLKTRSIFIFSRIWQGKAVFVGIILPLIFISLYKVYKYNINKFINREIIFLILLNIASIACTCTAIYIVSFSYLAILIIILLSKNVKKFFKLALTGVPIVCYAVLMLYLTRDADRIGVYSKLNIINEFKGMYSNIFFNILYLLSIIYIIIKGNKKSKIIFGYTFILNIFTIYNPIFCDFIAKYLTSSETYWRLFWLVPFEYSIIYFMVDVLKYIKIKYIKQVVLIINILLIVIFGEFIFTKENEFEIPDNIEKIPANIMNEIEFIEEDGKSEKEIFVVAPKEPLHSCTMRQVSNRIKLIYSRESYINTIYKDSENEERKYIYSIYDMSEEIINIDKFYILIQKYAIDYIILPRDNKYNEIFKDIDELKEIKIIQDDIIYKVM